VLRGQHCQHRPAVGVDGQRLVLVLAPVFALADEAAESRECHVARVDDHILVSPGLEQQPPAAMIRREVALGMDRRNQVGLVAYGPHSIWRAVRAKNVGPENDEPFTKYASLRIAGGTPVAHFPRFHLLWPFTHFYLRQGGYVFTGVS